MADEKEEKEIDFEVIITTAASDIVEGTLSIYLLQFELMKMTLLSLSYFYTAMSHGEGDISKWPYPSFV